MDTGLLLSTAHTHSLPVFHKMLSWPPAPVGLLPTTDMVSFENLESDHSSYLLVHPPWLPIAL